MNQIGTLSVDYGLSWSAAAQGIGVGVLVSLLFAMVPLLEVRQVKPSLLLRQETGARRRDWFQIAATVVVGGALVALASWQAASINVGLSVCAGFIALTLVLQGIGWLLTRMTKPLARSSWFPMRQAVLHLSRPGQSNARHPADGGARHVFHHGRARPAGEPARSVRASDRREHAGHVSRRHPAGPGCRDESVSRRAAAAGISAAFHSRAARARHRQGRESRRGGRPPGTRPLVARVHDYVPRTSGVERDAGQGNVSEAYGGV